MINDRLKSIGGEQQPSGVVRETREPVVVFKTIRLEDQADSSVKWMRGDLTASDSAGGVFAVRPSDADLYIVDLIIIDITTASSGACTLDIGIANDDVTLSDTLIDGLNVASIGVYNNNEDKGTNGRTVRKASSGQYVTASKASGATTGLVGKYYIRYRTQI